MQNYVAYYRVSTDKQGADGLGIEAQKATVNSYVLSKGGRILESYVEVKSGRKANREVVRQALAHAKRTKATLIVAKLDRLARDVHFISGLTAANVSFVACDLPDADETTIHIFAAMAQYESKRISERVKAAWDVKKAKGLPAGNPNIAELGKKYLEKANTKRSEAAKKRNERWKWIIDQYCVGCDTYQAIADMLNEMGFVTVNGKRFYAQTVKRIVQGATEKA